jgi:cell division protein FtsW
MLLFPEITYASRGARRWISFFGFTFQPGEIAKSVLAIYLARILSSREGKPSIALIGLSVLVTVIFALLLLRQPDFGGAVIMFLILLTTLFLSGVPVWSFLFLGIPAFFLAQDLILSTPYRRGRWLAFLDPWNPEYTATYSYQLIQSLIAFGNGGLFGEGLMLGKQKLFYLPEAHTDFVFSIIGEELGLLGTFFVLFLYLWLFLAWFSIAEKTTSLFSRLVVMGGMVLFFGQVLIHMGVTIGLLPTKGLTLPLISYGGSSLLSTFFTLGVVGRIAKEGREGNEMGEKGFQFYFWNLRERR